jgi:hypothetical protein
MSDFSGMFSDSPTIDTGGDEGVLFSDSPGVNSNVLDGQAVAASTVTQNPSLVYGPPSPSTTAAMGVTGGAAMNSTPSNVTVNLPGQSAASEVSSLASAVGQWGYAFADAVGLGDSTNEAKATTGATGRPATATATSNNTTLYLLLIVAVVTIILVVSYEEE